MLTQLAYQTQGKVVLPDEASYLIKELLADDNYKPTQKTIVKKSPLIDWI